MNTVEITGNDVVRMSGLVQRREFTPLRLKKQKKNKKVEAIMIHRSLCCRECGALSGDWCEISFS